MGISKKGRRRIVVDGRVFYWDYRSVGKRPSQRDALWDWPPERRKPIVRIVSEDKRWRLTLALGKWGTGGKVHVEPGGKEVPFEDVDPGHGWTETFTPRIVRLLIEKFFTPA